MQGVSEGVEAVKFGLYTPEEIKKLSAVKITNTNLLDSIDRPLPGGLYDPALGPLDDRTPYGSFQAFITDVIFPNSPLLIY